MIAGSAVNFHESTSPHSLGLQQAMTIPSPGFDNNPLMINQKKYWGGGLRGMGDITQLFNDPFGYLMDSTIVEGWPNYVIIGAGALAAWWLLTPGGSDYREEKKRLVSKHRGYRRLSRSLETRDEGGGRSSKKGKQTEGIF